MLKPPSTSISQRLRRDFNAEVFVGDLLASRSFNCDIVDRSPKLKKYTLTEVLLMTKNIRPALYSRLERTVMPLLSISL